MEITEMFGCKFTVVSSWKVGVGNSNFPLNDKGNGNMNGTIYEATC